MGSSEVALMALERPTLKPRQDKATRCDKLQPVLAIQTLTSPTWDLRLRFPQECPKSSGFEKKPATRDMNLIVPVW